MQAKYMIQMLVSRHNTRRNSYHPPHLTIGQSFFVFQDSSLQMLGPDIELLTEINHELGARHVKYGVTPAMYHFMGEAVIFTMKEMLGDKFDADMQNAWKLVYSELSGDILSVYPKHK